ncbi:MAG TPA: low-specificity L-threonine aldolase [Bellilinea sp.]|nr:low-specificity L-threonine aldolase [Bellilinea sp.]
MNIIDLRSDTVTHPTPEMREAMAAAEVGDDVYGEDPTVNELQRVSAERMGKEAGLFVASGTMGNLIAILAHCQRGEEALMGTKAHTFLYEGGGISALGGIFAHTLPNDPDGTIPLELIEKGIRGADIHDAITKLLVLEKTDNRCGGTVLPVSYLEKACGLMRSRGLLSHLDGARVFNAAAALNVPVAEIAKPFDSVTFCLSKALCAPVGSVLCGSAEFIAKARRIRKQLGGGMRQAGVLAAAGLEALRDIPQTLIQDHQRAAVLAEGLVKAGLKLSMGRPQSNMVFVEVPDSSQLTAEQVIASLAKENIRIGKVGPSHFRLVVHHWISDENVGSVLGAIRKLKI